MMAVVNALVFGRVECSLCEGEGRANGKLCELCLQEHLNHLRRTEAILRTIAGKKYAYQYAECWCEELCENNKHACFPCKIKFHLEGR